MTEEENRPSPEALLKEAKSERNGKLKIFLGAAPGVGKTYAMLGAAKGRIAEGVDTVIGIVETHQRSETQALTKGIETVPRRKIAYRGLAFEEMDIDAILKRNPKLVLIDELAHTNVPGARHAKRYQDVQEILEAGIDVYTTLNVQHIESLNDIVARITGVKVRETIPDSLVQMANAIELIDLPPDELLQRLKEGKVYIPQQARLAVNRFFTPGNLTALRELALRQAAERVDDQMLSLMRRHAISGPWPTSDRVMVCISDDGQAAFLVRAARRTAERRQAAWIVLFVETSRQISEKARSDIAEALALGESFGAEALTVQSDAPADEILRIARERNVSTIVMGKSKKSFWSRMTSPSVLASVIAEGEGFDIMLVNDVEAGGKREKTPKNVQPQPREFNFKGLGKTAFALSAACLMAAITGIFVPPVFLLFFFIATIVIVALDTDLILSLFATLVSGLALDALLVGPNGGLIPDNKDDAVLVLLAVVTGIAIALLANRTRLQVEATRRHAEHTQSLYDFTKSIAVAATIDDVAQTIVRRVALALNAHAAVLMPRHDNLAVVASIPAE
ncbi:MAG: universal stress protein, partial [Alphaproteobacteria bacterium]|nr:universal stress protein [Alphaproteobacteria bacterium]